MLLPSATYKIFIYLQEHLSRLLLGIEQEMTLLSSILYRNVYVEHYHQKYQIILYIKLMNTLLVYYFSEIHF